MKPANLLIGVLLLLIGVTNSAYATDLKANSLKSYMQQGWQSIYIKIVMPTHKGGTQQQVYEDNFSQPNAVKAQSIYYPDHTFSAWYIAPNGKKMGQTTGKWQLKGNKLTVSYTHQGRTVKPTYTVKRTASGFSATSLYDWDNDGEKDDTLTMHAVAMVGNKPNQSE